MSKLPKIRENLLVQDLNDEVLIYDTNTNKSYCLNRTAKTVFNACDGRKTFADVNLPDEIIYLSLDELKKNNLVKANYVSPFVGMSRREVVRRVGLASLIALPVISSVIAPTVARAASCIIGGGACNLNNAAACCSQNCLINDGSPICADVCIPAGNQCDLNNAAACCSTRCNINNGSPVCDVPCIAPNQPCELNNQAACCSGNCLINNGRPVCASPN